MGFNNATEAPPPLPGARPGPTPATNGAPPPVPRSSRPDLSALKASKPTTNGAAAQTTAGSCLRCRDFSAVDAHAARFPRQSIPSTDLSWLAQQVTSPFPSETDKARAIFTWLHHNIDYDTVAFYNNAVKPSTPAGTVQSGLAVCEGYAGLFTALASKVGLESVVVGGHGKGYGYAPTSPGDPLPPFNAGHAWNAVRIDNGEWKLIDCCWGAGHVQGKGQPYNRSFTPYHFTKDNNEFGESHFPSDPKFFFRTDGRPSISWEEYLLGSNGGLGPQIYGGYTWQEGISERSFQPLARKIDLAQHRSLGTPSIRFQFNKVCEHWDNERMGKGRYYCYILQIGGVDGREPRNLPFETNGYFWWVDVKPEEVGAPGQQVKIAAITSFDGKDGRGVTASLWREKEGRVGWGAGFAATWDIV